MNNVNIDETYILECKPFKAVDGNVYNVFEIFTGGRDWSHAQLFENQNNEIIVVQLLKIIPINSDYDNRKYELFKVKVIHGQEAAVRQIFKKPYKSKTTGKQNPVIGNPWFNNVLKQQYFAIASGTDMTKPDEVFIIITSRNKLIPFNLDEYLHSNDPVKVDIATSIACNFF
jgi:hypothetical protein